MHRNLKKVLNPLGIPLGGGPGFEAMFAVTW